MAPPPAVIIVRTATAASNSGSGRAPAEVTRHCLTRSDPPHRLFRLCPTSGTIAGGGYLLEPQTGTPLFFPNWSFSVHQHLVTGFLQKWCDPVPNKMATPEQEADQRKALQDRLSALENIKPQSLVRGEEIGRELNFEAGVPFFQRTLDLFRSLANSDLNNVPYEVLNQLTSVAQQALDAFQRIQKFSIQQNPQSPAAIRDQLIGQIRDQWYQYYSAVAPVVAYSTRRGTDFTALEREARGSAALLKQLEGESRTERDKILVDMQGALEKVRQTAAEAGLAQHAIHVKPA